METIIELLLTILQRVEHELLLFAAFWFVVGAVDELVIDGCWLCLWPTGRLKGARLPREYEQRPLTGRIAVLVPAWHEADVIGAMISHALKAWPQRDLALYVGCYCNDPDTVVAAMAGAGSDPRVRIVIHGRKGPTTKADCLNRLYAALLEDEARNGVSCSGVVLHDAEDMVHPAALPVIEMMTSGRGSSHVSCSRPITSSTSAVGGTVHHFAGSRCWPGKRREP